GGRGQRGGLSLGTGEAVEAPAFTPMRCGRVEKRNGTAFVGEKIEPADKRTAGKARGSSARPERVVIVGGGAAGFAAAEMLRREGFFGRVVRLSSGEAAPPDRPQFSRGPFFGGGPARVGARPP